MLFRSDVFDAAHWALIGVQLVTLTQQVYALQQAEKEYGLNPPSPQVCTAASSVYDTVRTIQSELPPPWSIVPSDATPLADGSQTVYIIRIDLTML